MRKEVSTTTDNIGLLQTAYLSQYFYTDLAQDKVDLYPTTLKAEFRITNTIRPPCYFDIHFT